MFHQFQNHLVELVDGNMGRHHPPTPLSIHIWSVHRSKESSPIQVKTEQEPSADGETLPLFHQPGKLGYYAPILGSCSPTRLNVFRNIGRQVTFPVWLPETVTAAVNATAAPGPEITVSRIINPSYPHFIVKSVLSWSALMPVRSMWHQHCSRRYHSSRIIAMLITI